jgi:topoisomerase-4 subunit A
MEEGQGTEKTDTESDEEPEVLASDSAEADDESIPEIIPEVQLESSKEPEKAPVKKIDFEITNPDDLDIDDKGQLGLF